MNDLHYAVVVGINRYPGFTDLSYAKTDAICFYKWLTNSEEGAVPQKQTKLITATQAEEERFSSNIGARPLRHEVEQSLLEFHDDVRRKVEERPSAWEDTRLYLYVAGHGVAPPDGRGALLFADCRPIGYWGQHIDLLKYVLFYEKSGLFREVVLLSDCCREVIAGVPPATWPAFGDDNQPKGPTSRLVAYATEMHREAGEPIAAELIDKNGIGFFTRALLEGLRGKAADFTGKVSSFRLQQYLPQRVRELANELEFQQHADLQVGGGEMVLCTVEAKYPIEIVFPAGWMREAVLRFNNSIYSEWAGGSGPWKIELPSGLYQVTSHTGTPFAEEGVFKVDGRGRTVVL